MLNSDECFRATYKTDLGLRSFCNLSILCLPSIRYTVDLTAGALLAAFLLAAGPVVYRKLSGREDTLGA